MLTKLSKQKSAASFMYISKHLVFMPRRGFVYIHAIEYRVRENKSYNIIDYQGLNQSRN